MRANLYSLCIRITVPARGARQRDTANQPNSHGISRAGPWLVSALALSIDMNTYRIAVIAGDGIGQEVIPAGIEVLKTASPVVTLYGGVSPLTGGPKMVALR